MHHRSLCSIGIEHTQAGIGQDEAPEAIDCRRSLLRTLLVTTALCPVLILTVRHSEAQTVGPGNLPGYTSNVVGTTGTNGNNGKGSYLGGNDGGPGGAGGTVASGSTTVVNNTTIGANSGIAYCLIQKCSRAATRLPHQNAPVALSRRPAPTRSDPRRRRALFSSLRDAV